jgi:hypothetical protein
MEHRALDFEGLQGFLLGMTGKAAIAKQGSLAVRVPAILPTTKNVPTSDLGHRAA